VGAFVVDDVFVSVFGIVPVGIVLVGIVLVGIFSSPSPQTQVAYRTDNDASSTKPRRPIKRERITMLETVSIRPQAGERFGCRMSDNPDNRTS
jgi:hypothetical protein